MSSSSMTAGWRPSRIPKAAIASKSSKIATARARLSSQASCPPAQWPDYLGEATFADAICDRLLQNATSRLRGEIRPVPAGARRATTSSTTRVAHPATMSSMGRDEGQAPS
jgi:hypothetical protein